jgi:hypothetical protein
LVGLVALLAVGSSATNSPSTVSAQPLHEPLTSTIPLLINEVYDSNNPRSEYFELVNTSTITNPQTIDLYAYTIYNSDANGVQPLSALTPSLRYIAPGQHIPIGPSQLGTSAVVGNGFENGGDYLALVNTVSDTVVDLVNWGSVPNPNWNGYGMFFNYFFFQNIPLMPPPDGTNSLSRFPDAFDTDSGTDWRSLPQTPGFTNSAPTPTPGGVTPTIGCADRYEPDDSQATAREIVQNTEQVHTFCHSDGSRDRDWVFFPAVGGKQYTLLTKDLTGPVDTVITLYDAQGNVLAENDDAVPGQGLNSRIDYTFPVNGIYYLQARDKRANGGLGYQYTLAFISTGQLPPTVTTTPSPTFNPNAPTVTSTPGVCYDAYEPDGVPESAKLLLVGTQQRPSVQRHSVCPETDADWVRFFARAGKVYPIQTSDLGIGLDTFMILFDGDKTTILAQNDDGGDGVASRIDFYPERDGWYYLQVKNAGDIGGPEQTYNLSLYVVPGVPAPPNTATPIIAPIVTVTAGSGPPSTPVPTRPLLATPTQGVPIPTPSPRATTLTIPEPQPKPAVTPEPEQTVLGGQGGQESTATPEEGLPNVPRTGMIDVSTKKSGKGQPVVQNLGSLSTASLLFRVFYDGNHNQSYDLTEGIRGIKVYFLNAQAGMTMSGQLVTSDIGTGNLMLPVTDQRVYVPYLGINMTLTKFPEREAHSLWLQPVKLPDRVP